MHLKAKGASISEYALTMGLICLAVIALTMTLGGNTEQLIGNFNAQQSQLDKNVAILSTPYQNTTLSGNPTLELTLQDGSVIQLANYPYDLVQSVEAVGGNGTQELLAQSLLALAEQLRAEGKIDEDQYQHIRDIATEGYKVAKGTGLKERAFINARGNADIYDREITRLYFKDLDTQKQISKRNDALTDGILAKVNLDPEQFKTSLNKLFEKKYGNLPEHSNEASYALDQEIAGHWLAVYDQLSNDDLAAFIQAQETKMAKDPGSNAIMAKYILAKRSGALNDPIIQQIVEKNVYDIVRINALVNYSGKVGLAHLDTGKLQNSATTICDTGHGESHDKVVCRKKS